MKATEKKKERCEENKGEKRKKDAVNKKENKREKRKKDAMNERMIQ